MDHSFTTPSPKTYGSPDFQPFDYSTHSTNKSAYADKRRNGRSGRYFNNYGTPLNHHRQFRGGNFHNRGGRRSNDAGIEAYVHWSMTEDPWKDLEKALQKTKEEGKTEESNPPKAESTPENPPEKR